MNIIKNNKYLFRIIGFFVMLSACFMLTHSLMSGVKAASETKGGLDYSLATLSQAATIYINTLSSPGYHGAVEINGIKPADAGGFVGFYDNDSTDKSSWIGERDSSNVVTWSYDHLGSIRDSDGSVGTNSAAQGYALYGYMLSQIGLDEVNIGNNTNGLRMMISIIFMGLYIAAIGMSLFFNLVISFLQAINPFGMFAHASMTAAWRSGGGGIPGFTDAGPIDSSPLSDFMNNVGTVYDTIYGFSMYVTIPVFIAAGFFMWLVVHKGQGFLQTFKPIVIKVLFIFIGVPFMFSLYDVVLTSAKGAVTSSNSPATKVVGSLFCDFENWVYQNEGTNNKNLSLPSGFTFAVKMDNTAGSGSSGTSYTVPGSTIAQARQICYAVNKQLYGSGIFPDTVGGIGAGSALDGYKDYDVDILQDSHKPKYNVGQTPSFSSIAGDVNAVSTMLSILSRYGNGDTVSASDYSSAVAKKSIATNSSGAVILFGTSSTWKNYDQEQVGEFEYDGNDGGSTSGTTSRNTSVNVHLTVDDVRTLARTRWTSATYGVGGDSVPNIFVAATPLGASRPGGAGGSSVSWSYTPGGGLSVMSMYNYLNSQFTPTSVRVTSPNQSSNDQVKYEHYSVAMVGKGIMRFVYLLDAIMLLGAVSIIGYGYGFAMMIGNFRALIQMVPKVLVGMIGSVRGIAAAFALTFAMISEVGVTVILFDVAVTIVYAMYGLIETPLTQVLSSGLGAISGGEGGSTLVVALLGIISITVIFFVCQKLLQWRSAVVAATTQACTNMINKLLNEQVATPNLDMDSSSMMGKALTAGGLAVAGAQYASNMGLINPDTKANLKDKGHNLLSAFSGDKGAQNLDSLLGVKRSNGLGEVKVPNNNANSGYAISDGKMADMQKRDQGRGLDDSSFYSTISESEEQDFLASTEEGAEGNALAGGSPTEKTLKDYKAEGGAVSVPTGHTKKSFADGTVVESDTSIVDGNTVVETTETNAGAGTKTKSKLVDNTDMSELTSDSYLNGKQTEHSVVKTDKATGDQEIHKVNKLASGDVVVDQTYTHDAAGNVRVTTTETGSNQDYGKYSSESTTTISAKSGDRQTTTVVNGTKCGQMQIHENVRTSSSGEVTVTRTVNNSDGTSSQSSSTTNSAGQLMKSSSIKYSSENIETERTETEVRNVNNSEKVITNTIAGNTHTHTIQVTGGGTRSIETSVTNGNSSPVTTRDTYVLNKTTGQYDQTSHVVNDKAYTVNNNTFVDNITSFNSGSTTTHTNNSGSFIKGPGGRTVQNIGNRF